MNDEQEDPRPRDLDAERAVLGACLADPDAIAEATTITRPADFYRPPHQELFTLLAELYTDGHPTDPVSVAATLTTRGRLLAIGGAPYLHELYAAVPTATNVTHWAAIVADRAGRAALLDVQPALRQLAHADHDLTDIRERARALIEEATEDTNALLDADDGAWLEDLVDDHLETFNGDQDPGLESPYRDLTDVIGGLRAGQLVVVAGRPGMGKSVLGTDWAAHTARDRQRGVLLVSLEMSRGDVLNRIIAADARVRIAALQHHDLDDGDLFRIGMTRDDLVHWPIRIEDRFSTSMARLRAMARATARSRHGLHLIVVDYLQLLTAADPNLQRREQVDAFSRGLKSLAKELAVPILAIAQLNRGPEQRTDKKPLLSDLRESGSLEQDADIVILIHRPDAYARDDPRAGEVDLIVAKNRNGPTCTVPVAHQLHFSRFTDLAHGRQGAAA